MEYLCGPPLIFEDEFNQGLDKLFFGTLNG